VNDETAAPLLGVQSVHAPQIGGNVVVADMVVLTVIDLREVRVIDGLAIFGARTRCTCPRRTCTSPATRYDYSAMFSPTAVGSLYNTDIHQISVGGDRLRLVGSGSIEGYVGWGDKAAFRFGEHAGKLAVVSSLQTGWWGTNSNRMTILEPSGSAPVC
jgi:hypothetical protein